MAVETAAVLQGAAQRHWRGRRPSKDGGSWICAPDVLQWPQHGQWTTLRDHGSARYILGIGKMMDAIRLRLQELQPVDDSITKLPAENPSEAGSGCITLMEMLQWHFRQILRHPRLKSRSIRLHVASKCRMKAWSLGKLFSDAM